MIQSLQIIPNEKVNETSHTFNDDPLDIKKNLEEIKNYILSHDASQKKNVSIENKASVLAKMDDAIRGVDRMYPNDSKPKLTTKKGGVLVLDYIPIQSNSDCASHNIKPDFGVGLYYSSYIWVLFVIYYKSDCKLVYQNKPWFGMFPFFEHGNIADDNSYALFKRQLAFKALSSISKIIADCNINDLIFQYACASDHHNCGDKNCYYSDNMKYSFLSATQIYEYLDFFLENKDMNCFSQCAQFGSTEEYGVFKHLKDKINIKPYSEVLREKIIKGNLMPSEKYDESCSIEAMRRLEKEQIYFSSCHLPELLHEFNKEQSNGN